MPIPETVKVIYENNLLDNVICQVRFPMILKIESEVPSVFQEQINSRYPNGSVNQEIALDIQFGNRPSNPSEDIQQLPKNIVKNYEFASEDNKWKVNLTRNFLSLSTNKYTRWGEFKPRFEYVLNALVEVYKPVIFTRIGLRYVDVIIRSKLHMDDFDWVVLINPKILGILSSPEMKANVKDVQTRFVMGIDGSDSAVRVTAGTVKSAENPQETCFIIDSDYYELKNMKKDEVMAKLDFFNSRAFGLFRWCITDRLHEAMKPNTAL
jgi:uncharacterized protein (TIGR04255 family)